MKTGKFWFGSLLLSILFLAACQNNQKSSEMPGMTAMEHSKMTKEDDQAMIKSNPEFEKLCKDRTPDNWMSMRPMRNGEFASDVSCWGCMSDDGLNHFCSMEEYKNFLENQK